MSTMAFFVFILVNAALFVRPAEIVPSMLGWEIYFYLIVACLALAAPDVIRHLSAQPLTAQPITLAAFSLLAVIFTSGAIGVGLADAWAATEIFAKVLVYYLLFVSLVTTPARLRTLLICILIFCGVITAVAVLRYHDIIHVATMTTVKDNVQGTYGQELSIQRLQGTGVFQDPNELCVLLSAMVPAAMYFLMTGRNIVFRIACAALLPLFGYAVYLTYSRGGFVAFIGGLGTLFWMRYGWKRSLLLGVVGLPILLVLFGGRQTEISTTAGTAQSRFELWRDWLQTFKENPILGKSMSMHKDEEKLKAAFEEGRHLAHNSYLQAFADLGFAGGFLFVGAFFTAVWSVYRFRADRCVQLNFDLKQLQPYIFACVVAYCLGMASLTMCFVIPTCMMLALAVSYTRMAGASCLVAPPPLRLDPVLLGSWLGAGVSCLAAIYIFARFLA
jgi:O-antigen ligase